MKWQRHDSVGESSRAWSSSAAVRYRIVPKHPPSFAPAACQDSS